MIRIKLAILTVLMLIVAGCGGGSGTSGPEMLALQAEPAAQAEARPDVEPVALTDSVTVAAPAVPQDDDADNDEDPLADERRQAEEAITGAEAQAARQEAASEIAADKEALEAQLVTVPGSQSQTDRFYLSYRSAGTHAEFDGEDVRVHLPDYFRGYPVVLSSVLDKVGSMAAPSRLEGYSRRTWRLLDGGPLAVVSVRWNDEDDGDYLAAGWWVREGYGGSELEANVFYDGPELRGTLPDSITLPLRGRAVYTGEAQGFYTTEGGVACTAFPCEIPTSSGAGEFAADAKLVADFARGDVEGCVGCRQGIRFTPADYDLASGDVERGSPVTKDYLFWLHRAGFLESTYTLGAFAGALTVAPLGGAAAGYGFWEGRFSNLPDSVGSPRLLAATLQGKFEDGSATTRFNGVLSAESRAFGNSR